MSQPQTWRKKKGGGYISSPLTRLEGAVFTPDIPGKTHPLQTEQPHPFLVELVQERLAKIEKIQYLNHTHPLFREWHKANHHFLEEKLGRAYLERYRLIPFSAAQRNGFTFKRPSVSWQDKEYYQRGLQRARIFLKGILMELKEQTLKGGKLI